MTAEKYILGSHNYISQDLLTINNKTQCHKNWKLPEVNFKLCIVNHVWHMQWCFDPRKEWKVRTLSMRYNIKFFLLDTFLFLTEWPHALLIYWITWSISRLCAWNNQHVNYQKENQHVLYLNKFVVITIKETRLVVSKRKKEKLNGRYF